MWCDPSVSNRAEHGRVSKAGRAVSILVLRALRTDLTLNYFYSTTQRP